MKREAKRITFKTPYVTQLLPSVVWSTALRLQFNTVPCFGHINHGIAKICK